jgi:CHAT domain-containing protein
MHTSYSPIELMAANNAINQMIFHSQGKLRENPTCNYHKSVYSYWNNRRKQLPTQYDLV